MKKFKADTSLQEKLKAAADVDAVASIAIEAGFSISADDLNKSSELSEEELEELEELEEVAGGCGGRASFNGISVVTCGGGKSGC